MGINHPSETSHQHQRCSVVCLSLPRSSLPSFLLNCSQTLRWQLCDQAFSPARMNPKSRTTHLPVWQWWRGVLTWLPSFILQRRVFGLVKGHSLILRHLLSSFLGLEQYWQQQSWKDSGCQTLAGSPQISKEKLKNIVRWRKVCHGLTGISLSSSCEMKTQCHPVTKTANQKFNYQFMFSARLILGNRF